VPATDVAPVAPAAPAADGVPALPPPDRWPAIAPRPWVPDGWFGIGLRCTECGWDVDEENEIREWSFSEPPSITNVEPGGPADRAGLRRGDVVTKVDGEDITTEEGGRRFGTAEPGAAVEWTIERAGVTRRIRITAEPRPSADPSYAEPQMRGVPAPDGQPPRTDAVAAPLAGLASQPQGPYALRYAGTVGDAEIEVRAAGSVIVNVIEPGRLIEIVTGDSRTTVRLRPDEK